MAGIHPELTPDPPERVPSRHWLPRSPTPTAIPGRVLIAAMSSTVSVHDTERADIAVIVIEDLCWSIATAGWSARKPAIWRRKARAAWLADGATLQAKRERIREMAIETGLCLRRT